MTFNAYISLNSKYYATLQKSWEPVPIKMATERVNLDGSRDVTYGPAIFVDFEGEIVAPVTSPGSGWGSYSDLMTAIGSTAAVAFVDHEGNSYNVHILGPFSKRSLLPDWLASSNKWYVGVRLVHA